MAFDSHGPHPARFGWAEEARRAFPSADRIERALFGFGKYRVLLACSGPTLLEFDEVIASSGKVGGRRNRLIAMEAMVRP